MISPPNDQFYELFESISKVTLSHIKALADTGAKINLSTLAAALSSHKEIRALLEKHISVAGGASGMGGEADGFPVQVKKLRSEKEKLLKTLNEFEYQWQEKDQFFRQALMLMTELSSNSRNESLQGQLDDFKRLVKQHAGDEHLKAAFFQIKDMVLKEAPGDSEGQTVSGDARNRRTLRFGKLSKREMFENVENSTDHSCLDSLKEAYCDFIRGLRMSLGNPYVKPFSKLASRVEAVVDFEDFKPIRKDILILLRNFIGTIRAEREAAAAAVIHEIGRQVNEMECFLSDSMLHVKKSNQSNVDFNSRMAAELKALNQSANFSQTLEELKASVVSKLFVIKSAIEQKRREDQLRNNDISQKMERLRRCFGEMKKEATVANEKARELKKQLLLDPLTGALNRKAYNMKIQEEMERYLRYNRPFSVLLFDVDHFKKINDRHGHAIGDKCLQEIVLRAKGVLRQNDMLFRFGGEEFIVLLPEAREDGAVQVAEKLRRTIEKIDFIHKEQTLKITISIGLTTVNSSDKDVSTLFQRVDAAMYEAKQRGRNRVVLR